MAYTQAQLDAIDRALAAGVTRVTYEGNTTEYRSVDDMLKIRAIAAADVAAASGGTPVRQIYATTRKGL